MKRSSIFNPTQLSAVVVDGFYTAMVRADADQPAGILRCPPALQPAAMDAEQFRSLTFTHQGALFWDEGDFTPHGGPITDTLLIVNDGQRLALSNYWQTEFNTKGAFYLSVNAGAARLLVPDSQVATVAEMQTGHLAVITYGWFDGEEAIELLFDDGSNTPFFIQISLTQCDRRITETADAFPLVVYSAGVEVWRCAAHVRVRSTLPCLEAWHGK